MRLAFGATVLLSAAFWPLVTASRDALEFDVSVEGVAYDSVDADGVLIVTNRVTEPLRLVAIEPSCDCVQVTSPAWERLEPLGSRRVRFALSDRPAWVRPRATVEFELAGQRISNSVDLLPAPPE